MPFSPFCSNLREMTSRKKKAPAGPEELAAAVRSGNRKALARAITLIESTRSDDRPAAEALLDRLAPHTGRAVRVGVTGPPGVGKSTLIESLGNHLIDIGHRVAVLSVDPSSSLSGGSILGDKTRMTRLAAREEAFIRPSPAGASLGGVARRTREALMLCEAADYDVIIVETVGVGQSETAVAEMTDVFVLMLLPGGGDELQGVKKGIFELVDLVLVNKDDGDLKAAAARSAAAARAALALTRPRAPGWKVPVLSCSALEGTGVAGAWESLLKCRRYLDESGQLQGRRAEQARAWMWAEAAESLLSSLRDHPAVQSSVTGLEKVVSAGELAPPSAARRLLAAFLPAEGEWEAGAKDGSIGRLNHVAVAVPDLGSAVSLYRKLLGASVSEPQELREHGVRAAFVDLSNTKVELLEPLGDDSPLAAFLHKNPGGGVHHVCYEVRDIAAAAHRLQEGGARVLGPPRRGAHGKPILFLHPKDFCGTLIELEEI
jgi:LAO/AO transport system kinase